MARRRRRGQAGSARLENVNGFPNGGSEYGVANAFDIR